MKAALGCGFSKVVAAQSAGEAAIGLSMTAVPQI